jgi:DNA repair protein RecO (recombination protein O)
LTRFEQQDCWLLHRRPWRESSLILELFSREQGRLGLVAKGARGARSAWRGLTEPFIPLLADWTRRGELGTLTGLEPGGPRRVLAGRALWCGLYANELLLVLIGRDEPMPELFEAYAVLLQRLAGSHDQAHALRRFELALLEALGVAPDLAHDAASGEPIVTEGLYHVRPETGLVPVAAPGRQVFSGQAVLALAEAEPPGPMLAREVRALTRLLLDFELDGRVLKTRELFRQGRRPSAPNDHGET